MSPFDPNPPKLWPDPILGDRRDWRFCSDCGGIKEPGHTHEDPLKAWAKAEIEREYTRLELEAAHSMLCAMAFDHQRELCLPYDTTPEDWARMGHVWPPCESGCVFCEAGR